jgi:hypothetical protein
LSTIITYNEKPKQAYIWLKTYQLVTKENDAQLKQQLKQFQNVYSLDGDFLDKVSTNTLANIKNGEFKTPKF